MTGAGGSADDPPTGEPTEWPCGPGGERRGTAGGRAEGDGDVDPAACGITPPGDTEADPETPDIPPRLVTVSTGAEVLDASALPLAPAAAAPGPVALAALLGDVIVAAADGRCAGWAGVSVPRSSVTTQPLSVFVQFE